MSIERRYALLQHNHDATYVNVDGDTMTGELVVTGYTLWTSSSWRRGLKLASGGGSSALQLGSSGYQEWGVGNSVGNLYIWRIDEDEGTSTAPTYWLIGDASSSLWDARFNLSVNNTSGKSVLLTTTGEITVTGDPGTITLYDTGGSDTADRALLDLNGNAFHIYCYDNSATAWRYPMTVDVATGATQILGSASGNSASCQIGNTTDTATHGVYSGAQQVFNVISASTTVVYSKFWRSSGAQAMGYVYGGLESGSENFGFLNYNASWAVRINGSEANTNGVRLEVAHGDTYTTHALVGSHDGYCGLKFLGSSYTYPAILMFDTNGNGGFYYPGASRWAYYYNYGNNCFGYGGTTTSSSYRIYVTGSSYATGSWASSDARKKTDILTIDSALSKVASMRGVSFKWREDADVGQDPTIPHIGVIAQEIKAVVPEAVHYAADVDSYAVDYNGLVGLLIQAVKELKEELDVLKNQRST